MSTLDRWLLLGELLHRKDQLSHDKNHEEIPDQEAAILRTHRYPAGADAVLQVLVDAWKRGVGREEDGWVSIDTISARTGQRAVHSRISELRHDRRIAIEHNGRGGSRSAYRLVRDGVE